MTSMTTSRPARGPAPRPGLRRVMARLAPVTPGQRRRMRFVLSGVLLGSAGGAGVDVTGLGPAVDGTLACCIIGGVIGDRLSRLRARL
ncbi:hypothetical protein FDP22_20210 (plasmid) [Paroceanicella profunda]|uniref:Uncharacterized protein n=1 Tax=Paroceanicella profunda TaxID=2579971 RepID=A0A5B8G425_9RHOB|nr:hypothetical protein [Paroceanicella profunda]QDL94179.1 hypothetical protein FDP22_20210 [Paroceanicella profunda]